MNKIPTPVIIQGCTPTIKKTMAVKVLVTEIGQQILADVKQVENKDTKEIVAYWVSEPRIVSYSMDEETKNIAVNFSKYCLVSDENEFSIRANYIVSILEPRADVAEQYTRIVENKEDELIPSSEPAPAEGELQNDTSVNGAEVEPEAAVSV